MRFSNIACGRFAPSSRAMTRIATLALALVVSLGAPACKRKVDAPGQAAGQANATSVPSAAAKDPPADGVYRYLVGGDARNDSAKVLPWAFGQFKDRGASAFIFLGDMEIAGALDEHFDKELCDCGDILFYPTLGNHEVIAFSRTDAQKKFHERFLGTTRTPVTSVFEDKVVYSVDLKGGLHFIALDNVSQRGFGSDQLKWLEDDLSKANAASGVKHIVVGMHKPLAKNGITKHAMDEDGEAAVKESDAALELLQKHKVEIIFASHLHALRRFTQGNITAYISGGLGAPLLSDSEYHHVLQMDVSDAKIDVSVLKFPGPQDHGPDKDDDEKE